MKNYKIMLSLIAARTLGSRKKFCGKRSILVFN